MSSIVGEFEHANVDIRTLDDVGVVAPDGRYDEQKFRLSQCGAQRVVYLVEGSLDASVRRATTTNVLFARHKATQMCADYIDGVKVRSDNWTPTIDVARRLDRRDSSLSSIGLVLSSM